jgi:hypothetical protein
MGEKALLSGYAGLLGALYSDEGYERRCRLFLESVGRAPGTGRVIRGEDIRTLLRVIVRLGLFGSRRRMFWSLVLRALFRGPRLVPRTLAQLVMGEHMMRYTREHVLPRLAGEIAEVEREERVRTTRPKELRCA